MVFFVVSFVAGFVGFTVWSFGLVFFGLLVVLTGCLTIFGLSGIFGFLAHLVQLVDLFALF
jgi:hypothetical protein